MYLRLCVNAQTLARILLPHIIEQNDFYGRDLNLGIKDPASSPHIRKKVVVEFSSPNIAKEFQGKHLRSTIVGTFVSNMYENMGWEVSKVNYLGDWGKDIALLGLGCEKFGKQGKYDEDPVSYLLEISHTIHELYEPEHRSRLKARDEAKKKGQDDNSTAVGIESRGLFAEQRAFFKRMEDGDESAVALCERIRNVNQISFTKFYARLGINFDEYSGESRVNKQIITEIEQLLRDKGLSEESGDAWIIDMKKHGLLKSGKPKVRDRTGSSYFLRYLAAVIERSRKQEIDRIIFVAADKTEHFARLRKVIGALGMTELAAKLEHIQLNETSHMAEKLGAGYQPYGIINQCEKAMVDVLNRSKEKTRVFGNSKEVARRMGINALLSQELSTRRTNDHAFDISNMTSFKSGTGPDLQYQYAKLCKLLKRHPPRVEISCEEYGTLTDDTHTSLLIWLGQYPEIIRTSYDSLEPSHIMAYLHIVLEKLSDCLDDVDEEECENSPTKTGKDDSEVTLAEISLYEATRIVIENGMKVLGLTPISTIQCDRVDTPVPE
jgi:arginyl-tRNA synthetase